MQEELFFNYSYTDDTLCRRNEEEEFFFWKLLGLCWGGLTWVMSTSCLPSLVAAFFWALVGVWSVLELTSDEMLELPLPAKGERGGESGREREQIWISTAKYKDLPYQNLAWLQETKLEAADVHFVHTGIGVNYIITYSMCIFTCTKVADNLPCYRDSRYVFAKICCERKVCD